MNLIIKQKEIMRSKRTLSAILTTLATALIWLCVPFVIYAYEQLGVTNTFYPAAAGTITFLMGIVLNLWAWARAFDKSID